MALPVSLQEQIQEARDWEISYKTLHPEAILQDRHSGRNLLIPFSSLTNKYKDFLATIITSTDLDEKDARKYLYNPKLLSYDIYETTEFWNDLLIINNCYSIFEFAPRKNFRYYDPSQLKEVLNEILILEGVLDEIEN